MTFLVRTIDHTATGREIVRESGFPRDSLTIGRGTTNDIVLPDLAVEQHHATIAQTDGGRVRVTSAGTRDFAFEGHSSRQIDFDPGAGGELVIGSYTLGFARATDGRVAITVSRQERDFGNRDVLRGFDLASALPGKRTMAWVGFGVILLAFLAIPVWSHLTRPDRQPGAQGADQVALDSSWSTGKLSLAHHGLEENCEACHVEPFVSVRDETCLACHQEIGDHAGKPRMAVARGPFATGEALQWAVADAFGKEGPEACTTCHTEHEGAGRMEPAAEQFCASCHGTMDTRLTDTKLGNAGDFGTHHPQLQALVYRTPGSTRTTRISLGDAPREDHGLRFPHALHLSGSGGVARMAGSLARYGDGLECADCHRPRDDGVGFLPVEMEEDCESCHSLVYDRVGSTFRTLRHGDVAQMQADLMALDRAPRRPIAMDRRRPGEFARGGRYFQDFGRPTQNYIGIRQALSRDGVCGECHIPTTEGGRPSVVPVKLRSSYFLDGRFDHAAHRQEDCASCHKAETSDSAHDVLLPAIATCRECHQGEKARAAEVPSGCAMCHSYHPAGGKKPRDHPPVPNERVAIISRKSG